MRYRLIIFLSAALIGGAAMAQTPPTLRTDLSLLPAPSSSSSDYRAGSLAVPGDGNSSPFRFSDGREGEAWNKAPPRPMDRDAVLGTERAWLGGRPPLDCAMTPRDARCH